MALIAKYNQALDLVNFMSRLAREELVHHEQVLRIMKKRRIEARPVSASPLYLGLRKQVRNLVTANWSIPWWWAPSSRRAVAAFRGAGAAPGRGTGQILQRPAQVRGSPLPGLSQAGLPVWRGERCRAVPSSVCVRPSVS